MASTLLLREAMRYRWLWLGTLAVGCLLNPQPDLPQDSARGQGPNGAGASASGGTGGTGTTSGDMDAGAGDPGIQIPPGAPCVESGGGAGAGGDGAGSGACPAIEDPAGGAGGGSDGGAGGGSDGGASGASGTAGELANAGTGLK